MAVTVAGLSCPFVATRDFAEIARSRFGCSVPRSHLQRLGRSPGCAGGPGWRELTIAEASQVEAPAAAARLAGCPAEQPDRGLMQRQSLDSTGRSPATDGPPEIAATRQRCRDPRPRPRLRCKHRSCADAPERPAPQLEARVVYKPVGNRLGRTRIHQMKPPETHQWQILQRVSSCPP